MENEFLTLELEKLKIKYSNLKKILQKRSIAETTEIATPIVPKLNLPTPRSNDTQNGSDLDTPRSQASNSVYVVPIPVFDIDSSDETNFHPSTQVLDNNLQGKQFDRFSDHRIVI